MSAWESNEPQRERENGNTMGGVSSAPMYGAPLPYRDAMAGGTVKIVSNEPDTAAALIAQARRRLEEVERLLAEHDALVREREDARGHDRRSRRTEEAMSTNGIHHVDADTASRAALYTIATEQTRMRVEHREQGDVLRAIARERRGVHYPTIALLGAILVVLGYLAALGRDVRDIGRELTHQHQDVR